MRESWFCGGEEFYLQVVEFSLAMIRIYSLVSKMELFWFSCGLLCQGHVLSLHRAPLDMVSCVFFMGYCFLESIVI